MNCSINYQLFLAARFFPPSLYFSFFLMIYCFGSCLRANSFEDILQQPLDFLTNYLYYYCSLWATLVPLCEWLATLLSNDYSVWLNLSLIDKRFTHSQMISWIVVLRNLEALFKTYTNDLFFGYFLGMKLLSQYRFKTITLWVQCDCKL